MAKTLAMFPGQGSQYVGMGRKLFEEFPRTKEVFEEAEDAINLNLRKLCWDGPESELKLTAQTQPAILTTSVATWRVLKEETGLFPDAFAGHSLGEYSALVAAQKMTLRDAVTLVRQRGLAMQDAVPDGRGAMAAVLKMPIKDLEKACAALNSSQGRPSVEIANFNAPDQTVVAGYKTVLTTLVQDLKAQGFRAILLPVSAPFHSSLMKPARDKMTPLLSPQLIHSNDALIICNVTGTIADPYQIELLIEQIDHPVKWSQSLESAWEMGIRRYVEVGPGKVLTGLAKRTLPQDEAEFHISEDLSHCISAFGTV